jgi:hypothetical protein
VSVDKSEIKMQAAHEVGARIDDALEAADREALRIEGGMEWITRAMPLVIGGQTAINAEVDGGKLDLESAKIANDIIGKIATGLAKLGASAGAELHAARGKAAGLRQAIGLTKQVFDVEKAKMARQADAEEVPPGQAESATEVRKPGQRPKAPLKTKRGKRA